jgi:hypothetical protein
MHRTPTPPQYSLFPTSRMQRHSATPPSVTLKTVMFLSFFLEKQSFMTLNIVFTTILATVSMNFCAEGGFHLGTHPRFARDMSRVVPPQALFIASFLGAFSERTITKQVFLSTLAFY